MINKKLSDLFLRKQAKKQQPKPILYFDENAFHCKLATGGINTDLIKIQTQIKETGQPLDQMKCKWYIKNSRDFKQIEEVNSTYYQPCLEDVGSTICVQIQPFIEGKKYTGITIMQETNVIEIDNELQVKLDEFLQNRFMKLDGRIETIYSQNQKFQDLQLPFQVKIQIRQECVTLLSGQRIIQKVSISQQYPNLQFIRKSFSSLLFNFNEKESIKLSLTNNFNRDLFALIVRTCAAHSGQQPTSINPQKSAQNQLVSSNQPKLEIAVKAIEPLCAENLNLQVRKAKEDQIQIYNKQSLRQNSKSGNNSPSISSSQSLQAKVKSKNQIALQKHQKAEDKQSSTIFVLKLDELNKQLKSLKRSYDDLKLNYNIQKQSKGQLENNLSLLKKQLDMTKKERDQAFSIAKKVKQLKEDNRFYKNQISILKKQLKDEKQKVTHLQNKFNQLLSEKNTQLDSKNTKAKKQIEEIRSHKLQSDRKRDEMQAQIQRYKKESQQIVNQNVKLKRKLESLASQKGISKVQVQQKKSTGPNDSDQKVKQLQMKLKNLEMLLRYKSSQGEVNSNFQMLVSKLTQTVSEKELQINQLKKINKSLLEQLRQIKQKQKY